MAKKALITGVTGQDGAYLAALLLSKGYEVHGIKRRASSFNTTRIDPLYRDPKQYKVNFFLHYGDMTDATNLTRIIGDIQPHEIYNLAAQSHVGVSFSTPEYTANVDGLGTLRMLEAIKVLRLQDHTRFYQASTSELFGNAPAPQCETTPFEPRSPYGAAKLYAYWIVNNYREAYGIHASNGILFNHESPLRGETFVSRKITRAVAKISKGSEEKLVLGNISAVRDWGHAKDYVEGMWMMLQKDHPDDYVLATGVAHTVKEFVVLAFKEIGIDIWWDFDSRGNYVAGKCAKTNIPYVLIDSRYNRPTEVDKLIGNPYKANTYLGWKAKVTFEELVKEMVHEDIKNV